MPLSNFAKINLSWAALTVLGISGFIYSKNSVVARRTEDMRVRQRMKESNCGDYDRSNTRFENYHKRNIQQ